MKTIAELYPEREKAMQEAHYAKYEEMAQKLGIAALERLIPFSVEEVQKALASGDRHLNTLPLIFWDNRDGNVRYLSQRAGYKSWSLGYTVCVLKHVARHHYIKEA